MLSVFIYLLSSVVSATVLSNRQTLSGSNVCKQIQSTTHAEVHFALSPSAIFKSHFGHYMTSSSQIPTCVIMIASDEDAASVLQILAKTRTPFAIKSGGHASNPGFSSTTGVLISLAKLTQITLSSDKSTVQVGTGNLWTDVYSALDGTNVNVVGGRVSGPGVGGFTLGGGYSWLTDQYGLAIDTVVSFTIVLPNSTITKVDSTNSDLFFALKGGLNRFGLVTSIVFKTIPQEHLVYGGFQAYGIDAIPALITATNTFQQENTDPKAQVILTINGGLTPGAILLMFYDGPDRPPAFDPYNNVGALPLISNLQTQSFASFSTVTPTHIQAGHRGAFHTMMTTSLTPVFMKAVFNESMFYGALALLHGGTFLSYDIEPFTDYGKYATDSAFPHANSPLPLNLYFSWTLESEDAFWRGIMQQSIDYLTEIAKAEGIYTEDAVYPNYSLNTYGGAQIYGPKNAARLREIQHKYDPDGVMLLAGGFNI